MVRGFRVRTRGVKTPGLVPPYVWNCGYPLRLLEANVGTYNGGDSCWPGISDESLPVQQ